MSIYTPGDEVLVPASTIHLAGRGPALLERKVLSVAGKSIFVDGPNEEVIRVPSKYVHHNFGVALIRIGDLSTEEVLLDPVADSLDRYFELLLPTDRHWTWRIRTLSELVAVWERNHPLISHVVIVGHGSSEAFHLVDGTVSGHDLATALHEAAQDASPKAFISLGCETGRAPFAKEFSQSDCCRWFLGAFQDIHGAVAAQYVETYFSSRLLIGSTHGVARRWAQAGLPNRVHFAEWFNGHKSATYKGSIRIEPDPREVEVVDDLDEDVDLP